MNLPEPSPAAVAALAPTGTLRAAINLSNFLLVTGKGADGNPEGVSPDMAKALAERLGVGIELLRYKTPGAVADDGNTGVWDVGNIGAEPQRAEHIDFTAAYCEIEATYLVRGDSGITSIDQVDRPGRTIVAPARAAYGLWLERNIANAELVLVEGLGGAYDAWVEQGIDALGGLRPGLLADAERTPGSRILDGHFSTVQQAMGTPKDRDPAGFEYLQRFVEAAKAGGLVAGFIEAHQVTGLSVAPPAGG
jgi:polar amino acid transport system substrate-binding protein